jgi:hypothetical protein
MKKLLLIVVTSLCFSAFTKANDADLFSYDKNAVNKELSDLQTLENYVNSNPGVTLTDLQNEQSSLIANIEFGINSLGNSFSSIEPALGVPSFLWGCVFGIVGVAIVYFVADDKEETKKAFKGCIVGTLVYIVCDVIYVVAVAASTSTTTP